jgi:hypothetical protein
VSEVTERARALLRRRTVLHMLLIASQHDPGAGWARLVRMTVACGAGLAEPVHASEVTALRDMTVAELFDLSRCAAPGAELREEALRDDAAKTAAWGRAGGTAR